MQLQYLDDDLSDCGCNKNNNLSDCGCKNLSGLKRKCRRKNSANSNKKYKDDAFDDGYFLEGTSNSSAQNNNSGNSTNVININPYIKSNDELNKGNYNNNNYNQDRRYNDELRNQDINIDLELIMPKSDLILVGRDEGVPDENSNDDSSGNFIPYNQNLPEIKYREYPKSRELKILKNDDNLNTVKPKYKADTRKGFMRHQNLKKNSLTNKRSKGPTETGYFDNSVNPYKKVKGPTETGYFDNSVNPYKKVKRPTETGYFDNSVNPYKSITKAGYFDNSVNPYKSITETGYYDDYIK